MLHRLIGPILLLAAALAHAEDPRFTVVTVDTTHEELRLFLADEAGVPFKRFDRLDTWLQAHGQRPLRFATNAGMYHADFRPVGLLVIDGVQRAPLNLDAGVGNFFLKPNGVFLLTDRGPQVVESSRYAAQARGVKLATQSGPLLLVAGQVHPGLGPASTSRRIRNGVGVAGSKAYFVISEQPVSFHELAVFFRDHLHCRDALYFDGVVSSLHDAGRGRSDAHAELGPIIAVLR